MKVGPNANFQITLRRVTHLVREADTRGYSHNWRLHPQSTSVIRHQRMLGLSDEDVRRLTILKEAGL